jgi:hypothetical protein
MSSSSCSSIFGAMAKRPPRNRGAELLVSIYRLRGTPAQFVGIVYDQPDEQAAIRQATGEFKVPANQRDRLMARRRN